MSEKHVYIEQLQMMIVGLFHFFTHDRSLVHGTGHKLSTKTNPSEKESRFKHVLVQGVIFENNLQVNIITVILVLIRDTWDLVCASREACMKRVSSTTTILSIGACTTCSGGVRICVIGRRHVILFTSHQTAFVSTLCIGRIWCRIVKCWG